nr:protein LURP-one-related 15 [Tanacetum cinerariifolium]
MVFALDGGTPMPPIWFSSVALVVFSDQMRKKHTFQSFALGKDRYDVTVYPNVDYAFIMALVVILHEYNEENSNDGKKSAE